MAEDKLAAEDAKRVKGEKVEMMVGGGGAEQRSGRGQPDSTITFYFFSPTSQFHFALC